MRRPILLAAVVLGLTLLPCQAQRGAGFHGAASGFHGAPARTGGFAARPAMGPAMGGHMSFAHAPVPSSSFHFHGTPSWGGNLHSRHHNGGIHIRTVPWWWYYGYRYPYYYGYYGGYYPFWWGWNSSSYDDSNQQDYQRTAMRQIDDLSQEVQRLRLEHEQEREERQTPPPVQPQSAPSHVPAPAKAVPSGSDLPVILVYMDKHIEEVKNYAVVGETLWAFGERTKKIPLMDIDLAATGKLNDERGVDFQVPGQILDR